MESGPAQINILPALSPNKQDSRYRFQHPQLICHVSLFSLKQFEFSKQIETLQTCVPHMKLEVTEVPLLKSQLRGYEFNGAADLAVVHHKAEGRLFLTDRNGFYHDLLGSLYRVCGTAYSEGRVLLFVTNMPRDPSDDSLITEEISTVAAFGDQPTVGKLASIGRVLAWKSHPTALQRQHICNAIVRAISHPQPEYGDLPDNFRPSSTVLGCLML